METQTSFAGIFVKKIHQVESLFSRFGRRASCSIGTCCAMLVCYHQVHLISLKLRGNGAFVNPRRVHCPTFYSLHIFLITFSYPLAISNVNCISWEETLVSWGAIKHCCILWHNVRSSILNNLWSQYLVEICNADIKSVLSKTSICRKKK